ncbi:YbdD/YjiX family protein [Microbacterium sp. TWP3-1-2b2]|uniref:YbdD/YjiX family protein n=1 Tax=Microbacterium sp. TWP3-1-2b2 TaxID=2804651 RepID=UPI003CEB21A4
MTHQMDAAAGPLRTLAAFVARSGRGIRWYMRNLMGDSAYETYLAHHGRRHPDVTPMTEREFWRDRMDEQDRNPGARCC